MVSLAGGEPKVLNLRGSQPRNVSTRHIVYGVDGTLQAVGFDLDRLDVSGNPVAVVEGVDMKDSGAVNFDVSDTGTLLYVGSGSQRTLVWVHRDGREEPLPGHSPANLYWGRLSPDGARVAVNRRENGNQDIWVYHLSPATQTRLTFHPADKTNPLWTRDGERVTFWSAREDEPGLYWKLVDSSDPPERLVAPSEGVRRIAPSTFAHDNVRVRTLDRLRFPRRGGRFAPQPPAGARPLITYNDAVSFHFNGEEVRAFLAPPSHTDGDTFVHFPESDVLHLGDVFRTTSYPIIDVYNGGTLAGTIAALELAIEMAGSETKVIPGHGLEVVGREAMVEFLAMITDVRDLGDSTTLRRTGTASSSRSVRPSSGLAATA